MAPGGTLTPLSEPLPSDVSAAVLPASPLAAVPPASELAEHVQGRPNEASAPLANALAELSPQESSASLAHSTAAFTSNDTAALPSSDAARLPTKAWRGDAVELPRRSVGLFGGEGSVAATRPNRSASDEARGAAAFDDALASSAEASDRAAPADASSPEVAWVADDVASPAPLVQRTDVAHGGRRAGFAAVAADLAGTPLLPVLRGIPRRITLVGLAVVAAAGQFVAQARRESAEPGETRLLPPRRHAAD